MNYSERETLIYEAKKPGRSAWILLLAMLFALAAVAARLDTAKLRAPARPAPDPLPGLPRLVLWAWERPEDLSFIDPREVAVAYLAKTIYLRGDKVIVQPRLQPLSFPEGTKLLVVVRIETDRSERPTLSGDQRAKAVSEISELGGGERVAAVQIDFDATVSEREFYSEALRDLRRQLPSRVGLSITALASWCIYDDWLAALPVDEAVPMLFRLGVDARQVREHLASGGGLRSAKCRTSLGISTDEPFTNLPAGRRVYIFHPRPWSREAAQKIIREVMQWQ
jgi:predicted DNA-binding antitoxin AbrB/MazE fold protein